MRICRRRAIWIGALGLVVVVGSLYTWRAFLDHDRSLPVAAVEAHERPAPRWQSAQSRPPAKKVTDQQRGALLARARVWQQPSIPIEEVNFAAGIEPKLRCRFQVTELSGTTPKFDCNLPSGEFIRVKYGKTGEVPAEVAATRLLRAMGFGADHVEYVEELECYGCPEEPFSVMKAVEITQAETLYKSLMLSYDDFERFNWAAFERKFAGREIRTEKLEGWSMFELDRIDPGKGGSPRAHVDALRLLAVFLAHWDNKTENQRMVCSSQADWGDKAQCNDPFLLLQDVGSTFGPSKVDLDAWAKAPIWEDRATCLTSMRDLPFSGATFGEARISEEGRRFLGNMLAKLSDRQLTDLFTTSRFDDTLGLFRRSSPVADWVRVFKARTRAIAEGPPCPPLTM